MKAFDTWEALEAYFEMYSRRTFQVGGRLLKLTHSFGVSALGCG